MEPKTKVQQIILLIFLLTFHLKMNFSSSEDKLLKMKLGTKWACGAGMSTLCPPTLRYWGRRLGPAARFLLARGVLARGPITYPTAQAPASWLYALWGRNKGTRGGTPPASVRGVPDGALSLPRLPVFEACGRGPLPTGCGCGVRLRRLALPTVCGSLRALRSMGGSVFRGTVSRAVV